MPAKSKKTQWIPVVTGLIRRNGQVLLGRRPKGSLQGQWEFPGGKIEVGEYPEDALKRELSEELDIEADIGELKFATTHTYGDRGVVLLFFEVNFWKGEPKSKHHTELKWVEPNDLKFHEIPEANRKVLDRILEALK